MEETTKGIEEEGSSPLYTTQSPPLQDANGEPRSWRREIRLLHPLEGGGGKEAKKSPGLGRALDRPKNTKRGATREHLGKTPT